MRPYLADASRPGTRRRRPKELTNERGKELLEDAFISYLEEAVENEEKQKRRFSQSRTRRPPRRNGPQACRVPRVEAL